MDKQSLLEKIKSSDHLSADERSYLINLINTKKYGLVWEDKPEDAEELLRTHLPVLREVEERRIMASPSPSTGGVKEAPPQPSPQGREQDHSAQAQQLLFESDETPDEALNASTEGGDLEGAAPNHILIEGDNLHALTALTFTHEGKVDVIYIDPPYNTGNKDFKYNDTFVDKEDSFRHSKWLSFMDKRLKIAKRLLSDNGVVFISIDDNEQAQLKLLCDEVFAGGNFIGNIIRATGTTTGQDTGSLGKAFDYLLSYSKTPGFQIGGIALEDHDLKRYNLIDDKGNFSILQLRRTGGEDRREDRPTMYFPIKSPDGTDIYPIGPTGYESRWRVGPVKVKQMIKDNILYFKKEGNAWKVYYKFYSENRTKRPSNLWNDIDGNKKAQIEIKDIFIDKVFETPKPLQLINRIIQLSTNTENNSIILDFFAGSGTTLHATMQLNAEDGGNRQCILVTNNENNICEEVTYERNKRVIQGYTNAKGVQVAGLANNNLRYYRTEFVGRERSLKNKRLLVQAATQMLCVKEDIYSELTEVAGETIDKNNYRCFTESDRYMLVIYNEEVIDELLPIIAKIESKQKIKIYVFAPGQYPYTEEFEDVLPKVELCALPDAIYKAYANVLPKK